MNIQLVSLISKLASKLENSEPEEYCNNQTTSAVSGPEDGRSAQNYQESRERKDTRATDPQRRQ